MPMVCLREPVPSSAATQPFLDNPPTSRGNRTFRALLTAQLTNILFNEWCCNSTSLTPARSWLASSKNLHTLWVRLPTKRTKVVTIGAPLKFNGLDTLFSLIFSKSRSSFTAFESGSYLLLLDLLSTEPLPF